MCKILFLEKMLGKKIFGTEKLNKIGQKQKNFIFAFAQFWTLIAKILHMERILGTRLCFHPVWGYFYNHIYVLYMNIYYILYYIHSP